jgi:hypothetical protein
MTSKNLKKKKTKQNTLQPIINPTQKKNLSKLSSVCLGVFKARKNLNLTPLIIWNHLTQKLIVLVTVIVVNDNFLFLCQNLVILSLSSTKKRTKKEENKVWY